MRNKRKSRQLLLSVLCVAGAMSLSSCRELANLRQSEQLQKRRIVELSQELDRSGKERYAEQAEKDREIAELQEELKRLTSYGFGAGSSTAEREQILISRINQLEQQINSLQSSEDRGDRDRMNELEALRLDNAELDKRLKAAQESQRKTTAKTYALLAEAESTEALEQIERSIGDAPPAWDQIADKIKRVKTLEDVLEDSSAQIAKMTEEREVLQTKLTAAEAKETKFQEAQAILEAENAALQEHVKTSEIERESLAKLIEEQKTALTRLESAQTDESQEIKLLEDSLKEYAVKSAEMKTQAETLNALLTAKDEEMAAAGAKIDQLQTQIANFEKERQDQVNETAALAETITELEAKMETVPKAAPEKTAELEASLSQLTADLEKAEQEQREETAALEATIAGLTKELDQARQASMEAAAQDDSGALKAVIAELELKNKDLQEKLNVREAANASAKANAQGLKDELLALEKKLTQTQAEMDALASTAAASASAAPGTSSQAYSGSGPDLQKVANNLAYVLADPLARGQVLLEREKGRLSLVLWNSHVFAKDGTVSPGITACIKAIGEALAQEPGAIALVAGHSDKPDTVSSTKQNAETVARFLAKETALGEGRTQALGLGNGAPRFAPTEIDASMGRNNRIEISIQGVN